MSMFVSWVKVVYNNKKKYLLQCRHAESIGSNSVGNRVDDGGGGSKKASGFKSSKSKSTGLSIVLVFVWREDRMGQYNE